MRSKDKKNKSGNDRNSRSATNHTSTEDKPNTAHTDAASKTELGGLIDFPEGTSHAYESYKFMQYPYAFNLLRCYEVTLNFIRDNGRILSGGMGVNYALKSRGSLLYKSMDIDYDFYTPTFTRDAYTIVDTLTGITDVDSVHCILGLHKSTMRVRYRFRSVADVTYVPKIIFDEIPTLTYQNVRFTHPCYQMIDQFISFARPYENMPLENMTSRWKKDYTRFSLLSHYYNIPKEITNIINLDGYKEKLTTHRVGTWMLNNRCIAGFGAYYYWVHYLTTGNNVYGEQSFEIKIPSDNPLTLLCDDIDKTIEDINGSAIKYYYPIMDLIPQRAIVESSASSATPTTYEVIDNLGKLVVSKKINGNVWVCGFQYTLVYLLVNAMLYKNKSAAYAYIKLYNLFWEAVRTSNHVALKEMISTCCYGRLNYNDAQHMSVKRMCVSMAGGTYIEAGLPKNYYPSRKREPDYAFDPTTYHGYRFDGTECDELTHVDEYPEECKHLQLAKK